MFEKLYQEDMIFGDLTSSLIIPQDLNAIANVIAKEECILAGIDYLGSKLKKFGLRVKKYADDGEKVERGKVVMEIEGNAAKILSVERTLLNILGRMSGIATLTREMVDKARKVNSKVRIAATRKTLWGYLDKLAVEIGGGDPHRWNLADMVLIKDNHIALVGLEEAIKKAKRASFTKKIEVEVENEKDAIKAAELDVDIIMLDNLSPEEVSKIAKKLRRYKLLIEVSGGITPDTMEDYAKCDVDIISMGFITHSAKHINFSLEIKKREV
ncbi:nicotinate-nucleotide pyrophosphorylase [Aciduliprofundum boonei T469]|nr:nicotinate-nucleotide pyrophosphorylase [Aciduliprofundum boonei T469]